MRLLDQYTAYTNENPKPKDGSDSAPGRESLEFVGKIEKILILYAYRDNPFLSHSPYFFLFFFFD
jgi:hypothetical protein